MNVDVKKYVCISGGRGQKVLPTLAHQVGECQGFYEGGGRE